MKQQHFKKLLLFVAILIVGLTGFYRFMTYDRTYTWTKDVEEEIMTVGKVHGFGIAQVSEISVDSINLPTEREIKIKIQKALNKIGIMNYGQEVGKKILLTSKTSKDSLICKSWCLSDHVIGLEIELGNDIDQNTSISMKKDFDKQFHNYKIVWTK